MIHSFELIYRKIDFLYRNQDYVEVYKFVFTNPKMSDATKRELKEKFYWQHFGKSLDDKDKMDKKIDQEMRLKLIGQFKDNSSKGFEKEDPVDNLDLQFRLPKLFHHPEIGFVGEKEAIKVQPKKVDDNVPVVTEKKDKN